ncbi:MAG: adenylyl-sulfate kinase [Vampirovibrionia bacterium]
MALVEKNITWHDHKVSKEDRHNLNNHKSCVIWLTGLSGSGKSTIANALEDKLHKRNFRTYTLDGDNVRHGLNKDLGFSDEDREENIRRISEVSKLFVDAGMIVMTAFISPFTKDRDIARSLVKENEFIEVFVKCSIDVCEQRDTKGLYQKARAGIIKQFTGIDSPYEEPQKPEIILETDKLSIEESVQVLIKYLQEKGFIND